MRRPCLTFLTFFLCAVLNGCTVEAGEDSGSGAAAPAETDNIAILHLTSPVCQNETAILQIRGKPLTQYKIWVYYDTGLSTAKGLEPKQSDEAGIVIWSWRVGPNTNAGRHRIVIEGDGKIYETEFETTEGSKAGEST